jgi:hypothetical protein
VAGVTAVQAAPGAIPGAPGAHQPEPIEDSWYEERSTWPANLKAFGSYPVTAVCRACDGRIRCEAPGREWEHVPQEVTARACSEGGECDPELNNDCQPPDYHCSKCGAYMGAA